MGECPFCKGAVSSELLRDGGRCPHCLIEVPGEETPTNPGEAAAASVAAATAAPKRSKAPAFAAAAVVVLALGGAGAWALLGGAPPADDVAEGSDDFVIVPLSRHQDLADPAAAAAEVEAPRASGRSASVTGGARAQAAPGGGRDGSAVATADAAEPPEAGPSQAGMVAPPASGGGNVLANPLGALSSGVGPGARGPQGIVLSDPNEIYEMVQKRMKVGASQLEQCYSMRLKEDESLRGAWTAEWVIEATGRTAKVRVRGDDRADPALEACMKKVIEGWVFQALVEPMAIDKTFRFGR